MLISLLFQCLILSAQTVPAPVQQALGVLERTFGPLPETVELSLVEKTGDTDAYAYEVSDGGVLSVEGTSTIALTKGFYDYVLRNGYGISSWTADRLALPARLPSCPRVEVNSPFRNHLFYNVCTYGYTSPFWGWKEWEHELDWLALHGFDMPLSPIAGEAILARVWRSLGLSEEEIGAYFTGPGHFPWMRMGNMTRVDGGMSQAWFDEQIALEHQILDRMRALGMDPVFQGFAGFVPQAIAAHFPGTELITTHWAGHESYMLDPADPLFSVIGTAFSLIMLSFILPIVMRLGLTRTSRIVPIVFVLAVCLFFALGPGYLDVVPDASMLPVLCGGIIVIALVLFVISAFVTCKLYEAREF